MNIVLAGGAGFTGSNFMEIPEQKQGLKVCCPEEMAYLMGYIAAEDVREIEKRMVNDGCGPYLLDDGDFQSGHTER